MTKVNRVDPVPCVCGFREELKQEPDADRLRERKSSARKELTATALAIVALLAQHKVIAYDYNGQGDSTLCDIDVTIANVAELLGKQIFDYDALNTVFLLYKNNEMDLHNG